MFYLKQFGICRKRNTIDALAEITEQFRQGSTVTFTCILLDLREAIHSINHEILIAKLGEKWCQAKLFNVV